MLPPLPSSPESGVSQYNPNYSQTYSSSKESSSSHSETRADGSTVTKVEYSRERSSYTVTFSSAVNPNPSENTFNQASDKTLTYSNLSQNYQISSLSVQDSAEVEESGNTTTGSISSADSVSEVSDDNPLLDGARNILKFIEQRIATEKANGADVGELAELWEQGLKGFVQGATEAYGILEESGQLSEDVSDVVGKLSDQVFAGFDAIYERYIGDDAPSENTPPLFASPPAPAVNTDSAVVNTVQTSGNGPRQFLSSGALSNGGEQLQEQFKALGGAGSLSSNSALSELVSSLGDVDASVEYGRKDTFKFELTTLDGDTITIDANNTNVFVGEYGNVGGSGNGNESANGIEGMKDKSNFSMEIVGELDDQEKAAIEELLNQVMSLADEFYNGDIDKAYEAAMELGYDQNEIASYSVSLRQTEQYSVAAAYQDLQPSTPPEVNEAFDAIGDFAQSVLETLKNPENYAFFDYSQLLKGISEQIDQQIKPASTVGFKDAVEQLVDTANSVEPLNEVAEA